jgi:signal peptidase II
LAAAKHAAWPEPEGKPMAKKNSGLMLWLGVAAVVVLLDQLSKITMSRLLAYGDSEAITRYFNLVMVYNQGAAFSFLSTQGGWQRWFFSALAAGVSIFIVWMLKKNAQQRMFCWSLSLVLGGAIGNLIDRIAYGHVIDFLDVHVGGWHWPAFNVADGAITIGAALFVLDELRRVNR